MLPHCAEMEDLRAELKPVETQRTATVKDKKMRYCVRLIGMGILSAALSAAAQTKTNTFPDTGNVGIGTVNPLGVLDVNQSTSGPGIRLDANNIYGATIDLYNTYLGGNSWSIQAGRADTSITGVTAGSLVFTNITANTLPMLITPAGNVGIGITTPQGNLHIEGTASASGWSSWNYGKELLIHANGYNNPGLGIFDYTGANPWGIHNGSGTLYFSTMPSITDSTTEPKFVMALSSSGNVGIGTTIPQARLDVNGNINISASGAGITFPNGGGTQTVAWTGTVCGGDYAESVDAKGKREEYEPGDVLVISTDNDSDVVKSSEAYSTLVSGIYSTKPGTVGRRQLTPKSAHEVPMAMIGIVPTKVSAENGPIHKGDLLVTASLRGYAMKGTDRSRMLGAIIGKAMGNLNSSTGVIEVLVTLQ